MGESKKLFQGKNKKSDYNTAHFPEEFMKPLKSNVSPLQAARATYKPKLPKVLAGNPAKVTVKKGKATKAVADGLEIQKLFQQTYRQPEISFAPGKAPASFKKPIKVALVLSGGQAPGGHNVVAGLYDGLKKLNK